MEKLPGFVFYIDIPSLLVKLCVNEYKPDEWILFIDSSKRSLKYVLLQNLNMYAPIPIRHSTLLKEKYDAIKTALHVANKVNKHIKYQYHQWVIYVNLKMLNYLLGQHSRYTKSPCFLCYWGSRYKANY